MLIRKLKKGDCLTIGDSVIQVRKATDENLTLVIEAPEGVPIHHARDSEVANSDNATTEGPCA